jgi:hypothetical protein
MSKQERSGTPMLWREFLLQTIRIYGSPLQGSIGECLRRSIRFRYLADLDEWHCRHMLAPAIFSDDQRARHEEIDLDAPIDELSDSLKYESEACGVTFRLEVAQDLAQIRFDRGQMGHALIEMVHDALRGLALGQVEARELLARITLIPGQEIAISVDLRR